MATNPTPLLFGKYTFDDVTVSDVSLRDYIAILPTDSQYLPHSAGRWNAKRFRKARCPIVERLVNQLMKHGRNNGKKMLAIRHVKNAFELVQLQTGKNPVQVLVDAITNSSPREDATRIGSGGVVRRQAVDVSPFRRVNIGLYFICVGARNSSFKKMKSLPECLANEMIDAAARSPNSYGFKKRDEIERVASSSR